MKSSSELEEEMLAKIPKFRAWPFNKKEFRLKTMERASRHADTCSEASSVGTMRSQGRKPLKLTEANPPQLETALRVMPSRVKSTRNWN
ncbi:hypothetical protein ACQJBY_069383 [Aegilops geniculata]